MARPHKATVDYFPHYSTSGKTIFILQSKFGNDGYAFWFKLLELLAVSEGHHYDYNNPTDWQFLLAKTLVNEEIATDILKTLVEVDAIDKQLSEVKIIWCQNFVNNIADAYKRRQIDLPSRPSTIKPDNNSIPPLEPSKTPVPDHIPTPEQVNALEQAGKDVPDEYYEYYTATPREWRTFREAKGKTEPEQPEEDDEEPGIIPPPPGWDEIKKTQTMPADGPFGSVTNEFGDDFSNGTPEEPSDIPPPPEK